MASLTKILIAIAIFLLVIVSLFFMFKQPNRSFCAQVETEYYIIEDNECVLKIHPTACIPGDGYRTIEKCQEDIVEDPNFLSWIKNRFNDFFDIIFNIFDFNQEMVLIKPTSSKSSENSSQ